jgi:signal peptidase I
MSDQETVFRRQKMRRGFTGLMGGLLILSLMGCSVFELMSDQASTRRVKIVGSAMEPNFHDGQIVAVEEVSVEELRRGDVIYFTADGKRDYLKRLIGLPGETIEIRDGKLYINDKLLDEPYIKESMRGSSSSIALGPDKYYVLGDNRNNSSDSRAFGSISSKDILGRVTQ